MPQIDYDEDDVSWLTTLASAYEELEARLVEADPDYADEDPTATAECLREVRRLAERLRAALPARETVLPRPLAEMADIPW